jgi:hypothetical protein
MTARLFRNLVVPAVALAGTVWILFSGRAAGATSADNVRTLALFASAALVAIVLIVLLSRVPLLWSPRRLRRLTVAVAYAGFLIFGCTWVIASVLGVSREAVQALAVGAVALLIGALALVTVFVWNRKMYGSLSGNIDERVIARRNETFAIAFQVLALACAAEGMLWFGRVSFALPKTVDFPSLFLATDLVLAVSLPALLLAWGDPDAVDD